MVDQDTGEPLPFATIAVKNTPIGTISNLQGEFDFHIPPENRNDILVVSMLGYRNFESPVWALLGTGTQTIRMVKSLVMLEEIIVHDSLTGGDILQAAMARIDDNFPMTPFMLDGFYRDIKKVGGTYISLLEAAVKIYDDNYREPRNKLRLRERVRLVEVRQSLGYESKFTRFFDQTNLLENLLTHNTIRYRQIEDTEDFYKTIGREKDTYYDGHEVYVVSRNSPDTLKIFIDKSDLSILRLEHETGPLNYIIGKRYGLVSKFAGVKKEINFKRYAGKMYLNFVSVVSKVNWYDGKTGELQFETELYQQLLVNNVDPDPEERITSTEKMRNYGLQFQNKPYNKAFWDNYNVIKDTPLDKKILADLEQSEPLEDQFKRN